MGDYRTRRLVWILVVIGVFFVVAAVVQWLWNCIIPWVIGFPPISYWQSAGILLLTHILFGGLARMFAAGCGSGCRCSHGKTGNGDIMSRELTDDMTVVQKAEYMARNRAFLNEVDDDTP